MSLKHFEASFLYRDFCLELHMYARIHSSPLHPLFLHSFLVPFFKEEKCIRRTGKIMNASVRRPTWRLSDFFCHVLSFVCTWVRVGSGGGQCVLGSHVYTVLELVWDMKTEAGWFWAVSGGHRACCVTGTVCARRCSKMGFSLRRRDCCFCK